MWREGEGALMDGEAKVRCQNAKLNSRENTQKRNNDAELLWDLSVFSRQLRGFDRLSFG
jgi:hypothetical protein